MINCLHHFEILTNSAPKLLNYFQNGFKFKLIKAKSIDKYEQYLIRSNSVNLLITNISNNTNQRDDRFISPLNYHTSLFSIEKSDPNLYRTILSKNNTAFNAAFQVKDLDRILFNCNKHNVQILKNRHSILDERNIGDGYVDCAIIRSCVDGVVHSLFELTNYNGNFLPGYEIDSFNIDRSNFVKPTHFDHLTYATPINTSNNVIKWYENVFNMKHFKIDRDDHDGLIVKTGKSGMNIKAIKYWLCAETGVEFEASSQQNDFKFVISEPLENTGENKDENDKNQISIFLKENNGAGIQHIGLHTPDIVKSVKQSKETSQQIKYYATPDVYYETPEKQEEIKSCGLDVNSLKENHVLLDAECDNLTENSNTKKNSYLLQVFTQPIFDKNTLFLELIQRVGNAQGFGAANIKALWNAVQLDMNKLQNKIKN